MKILICFILCSLCYVIVSENVGGVEKAERRKIGEQFKDVGGWLKNRWRALTESLRLGSRSDEILNSLKQIRGRIIFFRDALRRGVSIDELRAFKDYYIIGYSDEELAQIDLEIEQLLASIDEDDFSLDLSIGVASLPLEPPTAEELSDLSHQSSGPDVIGDLKILGTLKHSGVTPLHFPEKTNPKFKEHFRKTILEKIPELPINFPKLEEPIKDHVCFYPAKSPAVLTNTLVQTVASEIVEMNLVNNYITTIITDTLVVPSYTTLTEYVTVINTPHIITSTVSLRPTRFNTFFSTFTDEECLMKTVTLRKTEREVVTSYTSVIVASPVYITSTSFTTFKTSTTMTLEHLSASTMTFTDTSVNQLFVTSTLSKIVHLKRLFTETALSKTMMASISTIYSYSTVNECPGKGFLDGVKNWGKTWKI